MTAPPVVANPKDVVVGLPSYFSLGFLRPGPEVAFGSTPRAFGAPGAGGSFGFADPDAHLGYAYVMNKLDFYLTDDPREKALRNAVYRAIARRLGREIDATFRETSVLVVMEVSPMLMPSPRPWQTQRRRVSRGADNAPDNTPRFTRSPFAGLTAPRPAQPSPAGARGSRARRDSIERELQSIAIVERKLMVPMRDGKRMADRRLSPERHVEEIPDDLCAHAVQLQFLGRPQRRAARHDQRSSTRSNAATPLSQMNERGHFFSEGNYDILGPPLTDGDDEIHVDRQTALVERQGRHDRMLFDRRMAVGRRGAGNPALTTMIPQGFGAGVGRVAPYYEQGNWYRGGAVQMLFIAWLYGQQNQVRPMFPPNTSQEDLIRASKSFDLAQQLPPVDWSKALRHLPVMDIIKAVDGPRGIFADEMPVATGGAMIKRDAERSGVVQGRAVARQHEDQHSGFLVHVVVRRFGRAESRRLQSRAQDRRPGDRQPAIRRDRADAALRLQARHRKHDRRRAQHGRRAAELRRADLRLVRSLPQRREQRHPRKDAEGALLHDGHQQVAGVGHLAAAGRAAAEFFLSSGGKANTLNGDGALTAAPPATDSPDKFDYDPMNPVPSYGGNVCCTGNAVTGGAFDQRKMEERPTFWSTAPSR